MRRVRIAAVMIILGGWLSPVALTALAPDSCCCPAEMHGACARMNAGSCSIKQCGPDAGGALVVSKGVLATSTTLPAPAEWGSLHSGLFDRLTDWLSDPAVPPPRA